MSSARPTEPRESPATKPTCSAISKARPFIVGGLSGCIATCCIQPVDMVKVRLQLVGEGGAKASTSPVQVLKSVLKNEGVLALYKGLDAGITRQADATLPPESRRNYTGIFNAISRIVKEEGLLGLWRGSFPTVLRAMSLNMGMLATNDQCKEMLAPTLGDGWTTTLTASAISGFFAVTFSLPFDFLKTRLQKMRPDPVTGELPYRGVLDAAVKITRTEGITAFYTGYPTYYSGQTKIAASAPHSSAELKTLAGSSYVPFVNDGTTPGGIAFLLLGACCWLRPTENPIGSESIQHVPKWVDEAKLAYAAEVKSSLPPLPVTKDSSAAFVDTPAPVDIAALTAELARLEESEEKFRGDRRAIAFFAALIMVGVFLMFYFTTTRLEQSIKEASKLLGPTPRPEAVDLRL
ncbi:mitochondrial 2-oxoglutarate/malate carrier protein, putative [Eimeria maxima]|uniref:Mitochondrial 2-oxoglutarate/malate carrier protein, putative n=1 Tax=Eimeria maxima TaxID=5804 RepID=U6MFR7_EIMMA|nr:mitochondrial 2-oxoglutarate/malate carrier protein, putative [Eimeria maxima]CDJ60500.1 mitochondrial 2-oxoglutarate/malate carrier protein, putative [Eimeria maxima]